MSEIATPEENSVVETPELGEEIETKFPYIQNGLGKYIGKFGDDGMIRQSNGLSIYFKHWRYPGEKEWRR